MKMVNLQKNFLRANLYHANLAVSGLIHSRFCAIITKRYGNRASPAPCHRFKEGILCKRNSTPTI